MTETSNTTAEQSDEGKPEKKRGGLSTMLLPELRQIAGGLGIKTTGMKKADLVAAIKSAQSGIQGATPSGTRKQSDIQQRSAARQDAQESARENALGGDRSSGPGDRHGDAQAAGRRERGEVPAGGERRADAPGNEVSKDASGADVQEGQDQKGPEQKAQEQKAQEQKAQGQRPREQKAHKQQGQKQQGQKQSGRQDPDQKQSQKQDQKQDQKKGQQGHEGGTQEAPESKESGDSRDPAESGDQQQGEEGGSRRNRRRRGRDRTVGGTGQPAGQGGNRGGREPDLNILEDDVLTPCAGILDLLDNYAFLRTSGYLAGSEDVYVSLSMVRKYSLRRGDAVTGQVRQPREGERREKFNPLVRIDAVNGADPDAARERPEFDILTPVHPTERLRMETGPTDLTGRVIDLAAPVGKGQRGLIVSPAKAGKTTILRSIAHSVSVNNPECHLMVVLVDERPEEVTDFRRSVKGEVISSTFDRPAGDHTMAAELAIERAKRLVELGHDVVVLLDGITRLGRAYQLSAPVAGRAPGGVDSAALYPPKRLFGAARKIEDGGSLTILATATVESGSSTDEAILEEFAGTDNLELRLRGEYADKQLFPAIDPVRSGTRREELLLGQGELAVVRKLRRTLAALEGSQALESLLEKLRASQTNVELLMRIDKTSLREHPSGS